MKTLTGIEPITLKVPALSRAAVDELYHFLQYLQFKYECDLDAALVILEDEMDGFDADVALQETGAISLSELKQELGLE
ncbi:MAG: hypothetical protein F6J87_12675 [Spirulina sp. SIO3F2]|nr:hypothetical protein [Spirulina sp. SIO3F2]